MNEKVKKIKKINTDNELKKIINDFNEKLYEYINKKYNGKFNDWWIEEFQYTDVSHNLKVKIYCPSYAIPDSKDFNIDFIFEPIIEPAIRNKYNN